MAKFEAGNYESPIFLRVIKNLKTDVAKDSNGGITNVYGSWVGEDNNEIIFKPKEKIALTLADIEGVEALQHLILKGVITRVL